MMSMQLGDDRSIAAEIAKTLAARIIAGEIQPDDRLRQDHIALEFKVSHVPVREAFRRLEAQGLVVSEPRKGARVAALDAARVLEVAEMRAALEALALRYAMPAIGLNDLAAARSILVTAVQADDVHELEAVNRKYHQSLIAPCKMPRLLSSIADLHQASARHLFATWRILKYQPRSDREHVAILDAIQDNECDRACDLLANHILQAGQKLVAALGKR